MDHSMHGFLSESAWHEPNYHAMAPTSTWLQPAHGQLHLSWVQGARRRRPRLKSARGQPCMTHLMHASLHEQAKLTCLWVQCII